MLPWIIVLAILGLLLLFAEMLMPGFGLFGISGAIALLASTMLVAGIYGAPAFLCSLFVIIAIFILMIIFTRKSGLYNKVVLYDKQDAKSVDDSGFKSLVGKTGTTHTTLRPFGVAEIDGQMLDVCSSGVFIDKDKQVKVVQVEGKIITVNEA